MSTRDGMSEPKRPPGYYWYPGDWKRDPAVKMCSWQARAVWRETLDIMHEGEPYGHLTAGGVAVSEADLANLIGIPLRVVRAALAELESKKVFSRTVDGVIYSRRMVRDNEIRLARKEGGKKGGNPKLKDNLSTNLAPDERLTSDDTERLTSLPTSLTRARPSLAGGDVFSTPPVTDSSPSPRAREAILDFVSAANDGLAKHENPALRQPIPRIHPGQASALEAANTLIATGIPREDITRLLFDIARTCKHDGSVNSLGYFVEAVRRKWRQENAPRGVRGERTTNPQVAADVAKLTA